MYVYFDYKAQQTQTAIDVARILLKQLVSQSHNLPTDLEALYERSIRSHSNPDLTTFIQFLKTFSQDFPIYAVFDAMDECVDDCHEPVLALLAELQNYGWRLLISCRPHLQSFQNEWKNIQLFEIMAEESDLENYILATLQKEKNSNVTLETKCLELAKGVQGM